MQVQITKKTMNDVQLTCKDFDCFTLSFVFALGYLYELVNGLMCLTDLGWEGCYNEPISP